MIDPIPTRWKGRFYRSRLEARWAIFFDLMGLPVEYEHEGYSVNGQMYLPDFECIASRVIIEIKPRFVLVDSTRELIRCRILQSFMQVDGRTLFNVFGNPMRGEYTVEIPTLPEHPHFFGECRGCGGLAIYSEDYGFSDLPHVCGKDRDRWPSPDGERINSACRAAMEEQFT